ncbi:hypothetical protein NPIL_492131 [Nephila pilipes]|uniref:Uncharacterized protein n=1 Tax=Nephila pilipes TaxID=299642 RepID=A0A8X6NKP8_NEPPI|nr:hypothetical protein NPIL_492131 [Nephila pilipes]
MVVPWTPEMKHIALDRFETAGSTSTRLVGDDMGVCHSMVRCVACNTSCNTSCNNSCNTSTCKGFSVYSYADDYQHRLDLAKWMIQMKTKTPQFSA